MSPMELSKKDIQLRKILRDIGWAHCIICRDVKPMEEMKPSSSQCKKCAEVVNNPAFKSGTKFKSTEPKLNVSYNMDTYKFIVYVLEGDDKTVVYEGYIDDLWCYLGGILKKMGININDEE